MDKGSLDHTVAKKEFATEYDGVEELWEENLLDIVHDIDNVRLQELRLNTLRKNVPWTNPAFPGHEEYDQPSINRALAFYGVAQAKLASRVKSALAVQSTV